MSIAARLTNPQSRDGIPPFVRGGQTGDSHYRWSLTRWWVEDRDAAAILTWIMLNPSTANETADDPTLSRIIRFSWRWGFDGLRVFNIYPFRSADPRDVADIVCRWAECGDYAVRDAIWENHNNIASKLLSHDAVMVAWGAPAGAFGFESEMWAEQLFETINDPGGVPRKRFIEPWCLGTTKGGGPVHPMARGKHRVPDDALPVRCQNPGTATFGEAAP